MFCDPSYKKLTKCPVHVWSDSSEIYLYKTVQYKSVLYKIVRKIISKFKKTVRDKTIPIISLKNSPIDRSDNFSKNWKEIFARIKKFLVSLNPDDIGSVAENKELRR